MALIRGEPMVQYHRNQAASNSKLKYFHERGPLGYKHKYIDRILEEDDTKALRLGKAYDTFELGGQAAFNNEFIIRPNQYINEKGEKKDWNGNSNICKAWIAESNAKGLTHVSQEEMDLFHQMSQSVRSHPVAQVLLATCEFQTTVRARLKNGLDLQARPDGLSLKPNKFSRGQKYTVDLKTTADWTDWFDEFDPQNPRSGSAIWKFGYHCQGAIDNCLLLMEKEVGPTLHFLIVVEKQDPFRVGVVEMTDQYLDIGWRQASRDIEILAHCYRNNLWPGSPQDIIQIAPPEWLAAREQMAPLQAKAAS